MPVLALSPTVKAGSALRAIGADRQVATLVSKGRGGAHGEGPWKGIIAESIRRMRQQLNQRHGRLYEALRRGRGAASGRNIRMDGLPNLESVLFVALAHCDRRTGWIGDPKRGNDPIPYDVLFRRAFGEEVPGELAKDRLWGWVRVLKACGLLDSHELAQTTGVGIRARCAIKFLTHRFFDLLGLSNQISAHKRAEIRSHLHQKHEQRTGGLQRLSPSEPIRFAEAFAAKQSTEASRTPALACDVRAAGPPPSGPDGPPMDSGTPTDHIAWLKTLLGA